jgi:hypothetical protein
VPIDGERSTSGTSKEKAQRRSAPQRALLLYFPIYHLPFSAASNKYLAIPLFALRRQRLHQQGKSVPQLTPDLLGRFNWDSLSRGASVSPHLPLRWNPPHLPSPARIPTESPQRALLPPLPRFTTRTPDLASQLRSLTLTDHSKDNLLAGMKPLRALDLVSV